MISLRLLQIPHKCLKPVNFPLGLSQFRFVKLLGGREFLVYLAARKALVHCLSLLVLDKSCKDKLEHGFAQDVCALLQLKS